MDEKLQRTAEALRKRGFETAVCATGAEAAALVMERAKNANTVGFGGSVTIKDIGLVGMCSAAGKKLLMHGNPALATADKVAVMKAELTCDLFLLSANALTEDGRIVNIDGNGNRVAASIYGPGQVVFVVGRNKIVSGGIDAAVERIKRCACPPNCRRLGKRTPCAATGKCADCDSPDRICMVTVTMERKPRSTPVLVILVDEDLGY